MMGLLSIFKNALLSAIKCFFTMFVHPLNVIAQAFRWFEKRGFRALRGVANFSFEANVG